MYNGKFSGRKSRLLHARQLVLMLSMALLLVGLVGGSIAYIFMSTENVDNTFTAANVGTAVHETNSGGEKKNVYIENTGNISAYIRAAVIINWQTEDGVVYGEAPVEGVNEDYTISYDSNWEQVGDFWYHKGAVNAGDKTNVLISSVKPTEIGKARTDDKGNTYYFTVTVIGSGIQAKGMGAENAQAAWTAAKTK